MIRAFLTPIDLEKFFKNIINSRNYDIIKSTWHRKPIFKYSPALIKI